MLLVSAACAYHRPARPTPPITSDAFVLLHGHQLHLRLSRPPSPTLPSVLLVYATGDAGWWGKDRALFTHLAAFGYAAVGFSAREYVHHLETGSVRPVDVANDYRAIIKTATAALGFSAAPRVVLVGKSRGAGLALAAALDPSFNATLAGIVAAGLTREEEYVHGRARGSESSQVVMLDTYARIADLGRLPLAVIQSTRDNYAPAGTARELFGPDTAVRELIPIDSSDHNFGGALDELYEQVERSVQWVLQR